MGKLAETEKILIETDKEIKKVKTGGSFTTYNRAMKIIINIQQIEACAYNKIHKLLMEEE